jgi:thiol-disulfide isomerase/thioredoxin
MSGETIRFPDAFRGRLVLLDFWATWCAPCVQEKPQLIQAYEKFRSQGLEVVSVSLDAFERISAARVAEFLKNQKATWPQIYNDGPVLAARFGVSALPAAFLIDGDTGIVLASGDDLRGDALPKTIEQHLKTVPR